MRDFRSERIPECRVSDEVILRPAPSEHPGNAGFFSRREFLRRAGMGLASIYALDFLAYFKAYGAPVTTRRTAEMVHEMAQEGDEPRFLIYWYLEGGWESYDMFSPLMTPNNVIHRLPPDRISDEFYRVLHFGEPHYGIYKQGNIRYGYLAEEGKEHFPYMAVLSSMDTGEFHSGERLNVHMGSYNLVLTDERQPDERDVMQAFAEVYGRPYVLPNIGWFWWLADGELNEQQYTGRRGFYPNLGPVWAHTIYAGTPANLKRFLIRMQQNSSDVVNSQIERFVDNMSAYLTRDNHMEVIRSYDSALGIYNNLARAGKRLDANLINNLFNDPILREKFDIKPEDEMITYTSVNGNKARTKFTPATNVQAMMAYELMRAGLSTCFFIESRDIRLFDSHYARRGLWGPDRRTPIGMPDQTNMMRENLWKPLNTLVELLKSTPYKNTGKSLFDYTTIVITSEFGRTIRGDVRAIQQMNISDAEKDKLIYDQDISQHWRVTGAAFLGAGVRGNSQFGGVGQKTGMPIPLLPDGTMDPAYDPITGELLPGRTPSKDAWVPNHGDVYATALYLCGINPKGRGRNERPAMRYIKA